MRSFTHGLMCVVVAGGMLVGASSSHATTLVDFESGFVDLQPVGVVNTADGNALRFGVGLAGPVGPGFIASPGAPTSAFANGDEGADTPDGFAGGEFYLTDENAGPGPATLNYFIDFRRAVDLAVDLAIESVWHEKVNVAPDNELADSVFDDRRDKFMA